MMSDNTKFTVYVDDNYHYQDESARYKLGDFDSYEEAVVACKKIVDDFISGAAESGKYSEELLKEYTGFGEDPWISPEPEGVHFSAWSYAEERCKLICSK